ncbi:MAG: tetratricopeptide repeat protein [Spirochaetaceae bacterium]
MMQGLRRAALTAAVFLAAGSVSLAADSFTETYNSAIDAFESRDFESAASGFRDAASIGTDEQNVTAWFWAGRSHLAASQPEDAEEAFQQYLRQAPADHEFRPEARYQLGRVAFLQADFQRALREFDAFIAEYEGEPLGGNALYWSGESLLALGRTEEAAILFSAVLSDYPDSPRFEAARYRRDVIELSRREQELIELLRLSAEEQVRLAEALQAEQAANRENRDGAEAAASDELAQAERELEIARREVEQGRREVEALTEELNQRIEAVELQQELLSLIGAYADWIEEQE